MYIFFYPSFTQIVLYYGYNSDTKDKIAICDFCFILSFKISKSKQSLIPQTFTANNNIEGERKYTGL